MKTRTSTNIFFSVIYALLIREIKTRYGMKYGYFLALFEPLSHVLVLSIIFSLIGKTEYFSIPVEIFIGISILPWLFFNNMLNKLSSSFNANKSLFYYRQVKPFDTLLSRGILETILFTFSFLTIFILILIFEYKIEIKNFNQLFFVLFTITYFNFTLALLVAVLNFFSNLFEKTFKLLMRPLYFLSAIFYPVMIIPNEYKYIFEYNPIANSIELLRFSFFSQVKECYGNVYYLLLLGTIFLFFSLLIYKNFQYKILESR